MSKDHTDHTDDINVEYIISPNNDILLASNPKIDTPDTSIAFFRRCILVMLGNNKNPRDILTKFSDPNVPLDDQWKVQVRKPDNFEVPCFCCFNSTRYLCAGNRDLVSLCVSCIEKVNERMKDQVTKLEMVELCPACQRITFCGEDCFTCSSESSKRDLLKSNKQVRDKGLMTSSRVIDRLMSLSPVKKFTFVVAGIVTSIGITMLLRRR